jgi:uncharacterized protein (TIGR01777 family)
MEPEKTMRVLISGASGLIGEAISSLLESRRYEVCRLVRDPAKARRDDVVWQTTVPLEAARIADFDVIVHLAGRSVTTLWTEKAKAEIRNSRVEGTANLARAAAEAFRASGRPRALICSSAIGYYGSRGDEELVEESKPGVGFLAEVCRDWEAAALPAAEAGVRVVHMRTALVLDASGGALAKMLPAFRLGVAGRLGSGRQWWSWVSLVDAARAFAFAMENEQLHGAINLAAPDAVTNSEFTRTLGRILHRPALLPIPAFVLRVFGGEMAQETLLASQRVIPERLLEAGFNFEDVELEPTLRKMRR